jgi:predicted transcriptional regulator of viral defense system
MENKMKRKGKELGDLSSRFFAYVQLKKKDIIRTSELLSVLGITESQERDLFRRLSDSGWIVRLKRGVYLVPPRIPAGGKYSPGIGLILQKLMEEQNGKYQICGPTAFNFYGLDDQITNITYVYNNSISGSRTIGSLTFQFIKIANGRLGATSVFKTQDKFQIIYSSKARTLMDAVYDWNRFNSLPRGYDWIQREIKLEPSLASAIVDTIVQFGNQATTKRIGYLLDSMDQAPETTSRLLHQLSDSKALIPWIPSRASRGTVNRTWGIIVNG